MLTIDSCSKHQQSSNIQVHNRGIRLLMSIANKLCPIVCTYCRPAGRHPHDGNSLACISRIPACNLHGRLHSRPLSRHSTRKLDCRDRPVLLAYRPRSPYIQHSALDGLIASDHARSLMACKCLLRPPVHCWPCLSGDTLCIRQTAPGMSGTCIHRGHSRSPSTRILEGPGCCPITTQPLLGTRICHRAPPLRHLDHTLHIGLARHISHNGPMCRHKQCTRHRLFGNPRRIQHICPPDKHGRDCRMLHMFRRMPI